MQNLLPHDHFWWYGGKGFQHSRRQQPHILLEWPLEGLFGKHVLLEKLIKMSKFLKAMMHLNFVPMSFTPTCLNFKTEAVILPSTKYPEINTSRNTIMKSLIKQKRGVFSLNSYHKQNTHPQIYWANSSASAWPQSQIPNLQTCSLSWASHRAQAQ